MPTLAAPFSSLWRHWGLIVQLTRREISARFKGSILGLVWSLVLPLVMLAVYTFVFSVVFNARWGMSAASSAYDFALLLFCGLIAYNIFSECVMRAPTLVLSNAVYVKKVVFPLEVLIWSSMGTALFFAAANLVVLVVGLLVLTQHISWTVLLFPLVILPLVLGTLGVSWFLASLGVFIRDIGHVVGVLVTILLFMTPIFYPLEAVPERFQPFLWLNPLSFVVEQSREVLFHGRVPEWGLLGVYFAGSLIVAWMGFVWFQRTRKGFADVV